MRKYFCDSCDEEVKKLNVLQVPCHILSKHLMSGYSDSEGNGVSGRMDQVDLCNKCWNVAYYAAVKAIGINKEVK